MFNKDPKLRGVGEPIEYTEELIAEYIRCKQDIIAFAKHIVIETLDDGKVLFSPYEYQKKILKAFVEPPNPEKNHIILMQPRQSGKCFLDKVLVRNKLDGSVKEVYVEDLFNLLGGLGCDKEELGGVVSKCLGDDKIIQTIDLSDYEIMTDDGWKDISAIHKTKKYDVWELITDTHSLLCADEHIVVMEDGVQVWVSDLFLGCRIRTDRGIETVISSKNLGYEKHMYDVSVDSDSHLYYANGILSHNTTITTAYILWYALFQPNKNVFIIANKEKTAMEIMRRIQFAYKDLPLWLQQEVVEWNKSSVALGNGTRINAATTSPDSISGQTVNLLYIDEFAKIPDHVCEEFITSTYPVISSGKTSKIVISSTPVGMNAFYEFWANAVKGKSNFYPIKVGWWEHPNRDKAWKEQMIRDIGVVRFRQEFGLKFLGSQDTVIDADVLEMMIPKDVVDVKYGSLLKIYEKPIPDEMYVMGVDGATGVGADYSVIQVLKVIDAENMEQVAVYRYNKINLHDFAQVCVSIAQLYNNAYMVIENNLGGEDLCNSIWYDYEYESLLNFDSAKLGIRATPKTKVAGVLNMKRYLENGWLSVVDKETIDELSRFVERGRNKFEAGGSKQHDDLVMALVWATYFVFSDEFKDIFEDDGGDGPKEIDRKYRLDLDNEDDEDDEDEAAPTQFFFND